MSFRLLHKLNTFWDIKYMLRFHKITIFNHSKQSTRNAIKIALFELR